MLLIKKNDEAAFVARIEAPKHVAECTLARARSRVEPRDCGIGAGA